MNKKKKKWLIYALCSGRYGNQLIAYSHLYAFWYANQDKFNLLVLSFWPYKDTVTTDTCCWHSTTNKVPLSIQCLHYIFSISTQKLKNKWMNIFIITAHFFAHLLPNCQSLISNKHFMWDHIRNFCFGQDHITLDLSNQDTLNLLQSKHTVLSGFSFKSWPLVLTYKKQILNQLTFKDTYIKNANLFMAPIKKQFSIIIGVHIRQSDRKNDPNIQTSFTVFNHYMTQIQQLFTEPVAFILTSDDQLHRATFDQNNIFFCTGSKGQSGHMIESIIELSYCNYLIINNTTFSGWASFIKDVPIFLIQPTMPQQLTFNHLTTCKDISGFTD